jgi:hypothetical protein
LRSSLEKAYIVRGKWWLDLILRRDDRQVDFRDHDYVDENSMFAGIDDFPDPLHTHPNADRERFLTLARKVSGLLRHWGNR